MKVDFNPLRAQNARYEARRQQKARMGRTVAIVAAVAAVGVLGFNSV